MSSNDFFDWPGPIAFAHRGGKSDVPENTLEAFQHAYDMGYRYMETDVHYTKGGELVAFHDDDLGRLTGQTGQQIKNLTAEERKSICLEGKYQIPLLSELLEAFPDARFSIDAKHDAAVAPLVETIKTQHAEPRVCIASFDEHRLAQLRKLLSGVYSAASGQEVARLFFVSRITARLRLGSAGELIAIPTTHRRYGHEMRIIDEKFLRAAHSHGHKVVVWTINDETEMRELLDLGVDGLMTDNITGLKALLESRGQWFAPTSS